MSEAIDHGVLQIIGVRESHRGQGINLALAAKSYLAMIERGYKTASYTIVLDDNWPSRRTAERLGGRVSRNFNILQAGVGPVNSQQHRLRAGGSGSRAFLVGPAD